MIYIKLLISQQQRLVYHILFYLYIVWQGKNPSGGHAYSKFMCDYHVGHTKEQNFNRMYWMLVLGRNNIYMMLTEIAPGWYIGIHEALFDINSLMTTDAYIHQRIRLLLVQMMTCHQLGAKSLLIDWDLFPIAIRKTKYRPFYSSLSV